MRKILLVLSLISLVGCTFDPVKDTAERSGTFSENKAHEIINEISIFFNLLKINVIGK